MYLQIRKARTFSENCEAAISSKLEIQEDKTSKTASSVPSDL
jgi:hypothetical protein